MVFGDACQNPACKAVQVGKADVSQLCLECGPGTKDDRENWSQIASVVNQRNEGYKTDFQSG